MTFQIRAMVEDLDLDGKLKATFSQLANSSSDCGYCFPSVGVIAHRAGISRRTVHRHLSALENLGYIKREHRYRKDGSKTSNGYHLNLPRIEQEAKSVDIPVDNPSENPFLDHKTKCLNPKTPRLNTIRQNDLSIKDQSKEQLSNTPLTPQEGERPRLTKTSDPYHRDYKLSQDEQNKLVEHWNKIAEGRFKTKRYFDPGTDRALSKTYTQYKNSHAAGRHTGPLKTKFEFALSMSSGFNVWVERQANPGFYTKNSTDPRFNWVADLKYALRTDVYWKILDE